MPNPQIVVEYIANTAKLQAASQQVGSTSSKAGGLARKAFLPAVAVLGALGVAAGKSVKAASDLNETQNKAQVVFGKSAKGVTDWSKTTANAYGISQTAALGAASQFGDMFAQMGEGQAKAAKTSEGIVNLAGDLGSFHNVDPSDVLERMSAAFRGEYDSIQSLIPTINAAAVEQEALRQTGKKSAKDLTALEKAHATQALIVKGSANAYNDAAETADTYAGRQRRLKAVQEDLSANMGNALLPVMETFAGVMQKVAAFAAKHPKLFQLMAVAVAALAASVVILNVAMAILAANPVALIILGIIAAVVLLGVGIFMLIKHWDAVKAAMLAVGLYIAGPFIAAWKAVTGALKAGAAAIKGAFLSALNWLKRNWPLILGILAGPLGLAVVMVIRKWDAIKAALNSAWGKVKSIINKIADLFGLPAEGARVAASAIKSALNGVLDFLRGLKDKVSSAAGKVADAIKAPLNAVIGAWNALKIPRVQVPGVKTPGPIPDIPGFGFGPVNFPDIPKLARGGIVTAPTLALIGEAGPEAVVPLGRGEGALVNIETFIAREEMDVARIAARLSAAVAVRS